MIWICLFTLWLGYMLSGVPRILIGRWLWGWITGARLTRTARMELEIQRRVHAAELTAQAERHAAEREVQRRRHAAERAERWSRG